MYTLSFESVSLMTSTTSKPKPPGRIPRADLVGQRFGKLTVTAFAGNNRHSQSTWDARCSCGGEKRGVCITSLKGGRVSSCGCARRDGWQKRAARNIHGGVFTCSACKMRLPIDQKAGGRGNYRCRECAKAYRRNRYLNNKLAIRRNASRYREKHRDLVKQRTAEWRRTHPAEYLFQLAKRRAKSRGIEFTITLVDVVIPEVCPVLGLPLDTKKPGKRGFPLAGSPTLDRFDNAKGYVPGNVSVISWRANSLKKDANWQELEALVQWMKAKEPPCQ